MMNDEEFRAIVDQGPLIVMVEKGHLLALLDERDRLRLTLAEIVASLDAQIEFAMEKLNGSQKYDA
jgi:hypothetical protein